ncbi:methionine ABC transporter ATP-binding protein [Pseudoclavibacter sp. CFCC 11306]|uniref:methionine ABC transporter ATP-binding protein n=1 Tax=Pseudoclavibacter sp. CFCC 11306 TaxID=1564493 RepID=UPI001301270D|nr:methionine ABC transporter ATP-binding protein [Pseudoclavibacter sp. CFCC 11306]KAB1658670.1 methionine ABC transporter ATP-binding protein [Pseudoclavibacter sp. CFCC 11306]
MALITLNGVSKAYPAPKRGAEPIQAVDDVSLEVEEGSITAVIGYSGAGKSTLARLINALEPATSGRIVVDGREITALSERDLRRARLDIGMIFQQFNLLESKTVAKNVEFPLRVAGRDRGERRARVQELLDFVGLSDRSRNYPEQLSGGQKQRVGIARALATSPRILLADEATSALDPETTQEVLALLSRVNREFGVTIVIITHEMDVVRSIADHVVVMEHGRVVEQGEVYDTFSNPKQNVTRRFVRTLVSPTPPEAEMQELRALHPGRLLSVRVLDGDTAQKGLEHAAADRDGLDLELIYGGVSTIQGRGFGYLLYEVTGSTPVVAEFIAAAVDDANIEEVA